MAQAANSISTPIATLKDTDVAVTATDQKRINSFAKLNNRLEEIKADSAKKQKELDNLETALDELLLVDDLTVIPVQVGTVFIHRTIDEAQSKLEAMKVDLQKEIVQLKQNDQDIRDQMSQLKAELYGKFGSSINLEHDEEK